MAKGGLKLTANWLRGPGGVDEDNKATPDERAALGWVASRERIGRLV